MTPTYTAFRPARPLRQYRGQAGDEVNGLALSPMAFDALAAAATSGLPCELEVIGVHENGDKRWLDFGITRAYIEATTDLRHVEGRLRSVCPDCELMDGKHLRSCERR